MSHETEKKINQTKIQQQQLVKKSMTVNKIYRKKGSPSYLNPRLAFF